MLACIGGWARDARALDGSRAITQYIQRHWSIDQGLPQRDATSVVQTPDGYIWIGTRGGLARFDGVRFTVFTSATVPEIRQDYVWTLFVDREGTLWIGTYGGGLTRYRNGVFTTYGTEHGLSHPLVRSIHQGPDGALWVGTNAGLNRFKDGRFTVYTTKDGLASDFVRAVHVDRRGVVWIATNEGLNRVVNSRIEAASVFGSKPPADPVYAIAERRDGSLWFGTFGSGVYRVLDGDVTHFAADRLPDGFVRCLTEDRQGNLWIGTTDGLVRFTNGTFSAYDQRAGTHGQPGVLVARGRGRWALGRNGRRRQSAERLEVSAHRAGTMGSRATTQRRSRGAGTVRSGLARTAARSVRSSIIASRTAAPACGRAARGCGGCTRGETARCGSASRAVASPR